MPISVTGDGWCWPRNRFQRSEWSISWSARAWQLAPASRPAMKTCYPTSSGGRPTWHTFTRRFAPTASIAGRRRSGARPGPAIVHECCELDNELGWKPWKNAPPLDATRSARLMEMADILHFVVQLALDQGFSAEDMYHAYTEKNAENRRRQQSDPRYQPS